MYKFLALITLIVSLIIKVGCDRAQKIFTPKQEQKTLKIGFVVAGERVTYPNGAEMAVTEINQRGGLLGTPVELIGHINKEGDRKSPSKSPKPSSLKTKLSRSLDPTALPTLLKSLRSHSITGFQWLPQPQPTRT